MGARPSRGRARAQPRPGAGELDAREIAVFDSSEGWNVDNFEGLTRHQGRRFFMVSDDNGKAIQRTLLVYFEVTADAALPAGARGE